ncbi:hypothetical protein D9757_000268 [Collybiopsis confluens]|uniref:Cyclin N-terminal domain-containing protein n=1 Tax=Collybiopsis confluens TaxID=2823264 RepID=A0A8H5I2C6_9AGAR|nr:hypothetical protein D9757_000268 [Collybiopsis confluens]
MPRYREPSHSRNSCMRDSRPTSRATENCDNRNLPATEPIRLNQSIPTFPLLQLQRLPELVAGLALTQKAYLDTYIAQSGIWEQHTLKSVRVVNLGETRLLYRIRRSLLEGLPEEECPGLQEELALLDSQFLKRRAEQEHEGSLPPKRFHADESMTEIALSPTFNTQMDRSAPASPVQSAPFPTQNCYSRATPPPPHSSTLSNNAARSISIPVSSVNGSNASQPAFFPGVTNFVPSYLLKDSTASSVPICYHPHPPLKRWPNDYTVAQLSAGFHTLEALCSHSLVISTPTQSDSCLPTTVNGPNLTQKQAFERIFGSRYVKSTLCRHKGIWRNAPREIRDEFERERRECRAVAGSQSARLDQEILYNQPQVTETEIITQLNVSAAQAAPSGAPAHVVLGIHSLPGIQLADLDFYPGTEANTSTTSMSPSDVVSSSGHNKHNVINVDCTRSGPSILFTSGQQTRDCLFIFGFSSDALQPVPGFRLRELPLAISPVILSSKGDGSCPRRPIGKLFMEVDDSIIPFGCSAAFPALLTEGRLHGVVPGKEHRLNLISFSKSVTISTTLRVVLVALSLCLLHPLQMPVPVPRHPKQTAHLVIKPHFSDDGVNHSFQDLTGTLPVSPTGPPPSYGTREQWINSLPSWRRRLDFIKGLAVADNAPAIKGPRAEACAPPFFAPGATTDVEMHSLSSADRSRPSREAVAYDEQDRGAFTPIFEDESPESRSLHEASSSPFEPVTPFGDFVDQAVTTAAYSEHFDCTYAANVALVSEPSHKLQSYCFQPETQPVELPKEPVPAPVPAPELVTPTATSGYRKLSEPLSEWIANFVWKACTTGANVPAFIARPRISRSKVYAASPPSYLPTSIHSLLLSTLLQPSAIFLALWYIVRLPVFFDAVTGPEHAKEYRFRVTLLGENQGLDREAEHAAPFRLVVLGCMLANKWLDDHTFSNKTWHSITNVPIQTLNKLESLTLDIFAYDLSISTGDWSDWLSHVLSYHLSLSSPSRQPISRPSANPHLIVRVAIEEIINAKTCQVDPSQSQPVFIGLEERRREKQEKEQSQKIQVLEIDLDEGGPLREEYMPKRRITGATTTHTCENAFLDQYPGCGTIKSDVEDCLPPPSRWSPPSDEPILRESNRLGGRYVAVQPTPGLNVPIPSYQFAPQYQPVHDYSYAAQPWLSTHAFPPAKPVPIGHFFDFQHPVLSTFSHCPPLILPFALSHSRSQSYSYDQDPSQLCNHSRSYSQSQFEYRSSDLRMTANELPPTVQQDVDMTWGPGRYFPYGAPAFVPHIPIAFPSTWLRT